jgi:RNA recognition motif-containing protein
VSWLNQRSGSEQVLAPVSIFRDGAPKKGSTMSTKLYVGNLGKITTEDDLQTLFAEAGPVTSVTIPSDPNTGISKTFGFVVMQTAEGAEAAIKGFNGRLLHDHALMVNESRARK